MSLVKLYTHTLWKSSSETHNYEPKSVITKIVYILSTCCDNSSWLLIIYHTTLSLHICQQNGIHLFVLAGCHTSIKSPSHQKKTTMISLRPNIQMNVYIQGIVKIHNTQFLTDEDSVLLFPFVLSHQATFQPRPPPNWMDEVRTCATW